MQGMTSARSCCASPFAASQSSIYVHLKFRSSSARRRQYDRHPWDRPSSDASSADWDPRQAAKQKTARPSSSGGVVSRRRLPARPDQRGLRSSKGSLRGRALTCRPSSQAAGSRGGQRPDPRGAAPPSSPSASRSGSRPSTRRGSCSGVPTRSASRTRVSRAPPGSRAKCRCSTSRPTRRWGTTPHSNSAQSAGQRASSVSSPLGPPAGPRPRPPPPASCTPWPEKEKKSESPGAASRTSHASAPRMFSCVGRRYSPVPPSRTASPLGYSSIRTSTLPRDRPHRRVRMSSQWSASFTGPRSSASVPA
mmetsp:Transcript_34257/g.107543  ORF Transcript_34257/g.107543 Transcript_34257/m.107543 type:complete len:307 (-) Transcript_34257:193-1113(-)